MTPSTPRTNPFRVQCTDALPYRFEDTTREQILERLALPGCRAAIVGQKGRGKSTLLGDLAIHLQAEGWQLTHLRLSSSQRNLSLVEWRAVSSLSSTDFILLDGAEQLNTIRWKLFLYRARYAGGVLITTHRPGRLPTLCECHASVGLLNDLVAELVQPCDYFWQCGWNQHQAGVLLSRHGGNVREALRELYDCFPAVPHAK